MFSGELESSDQASSVSGSKGQSKLSSPDEGNEAGRERFKEIEKQRLERHLEEMIGSKQESFGQERAFLKVFGRVA